MIRAMTRRTRYIVSWGLTIPVACLIYEIGEVADLTGREMNGLTLVVGLLYGLVAIWIQDGFLFDPPRERREGRG
jgi:hypothetical protein